MTFQSDMETAFTARDLRLWIERQGGVLDRREGSHQTFTIDRPGSRFHGRSIPCIADGFPVSRNHTASVAKVFGQNRQWLLEQLGVVRHKRGKPRRGVGAQVRQPIGKKHVVRAIADLRAELAAIESQVACGQRDPAFYARVFEALSGARRELDSPSPSEVA